MLRGRPAAKKGEAAALLAGSCTSAVDRGPIPDKPTAAADATGLGSRHTSRYFAGRSGGDGTARTHAKLTVACDTASHVLAGAAVSTGPSNDPPRFRPVMALAAPPVAWDRVPADAAFDSEARHRYARETLGIRSTVIPVDSRGNAGPPAGRYRGEMARRFAPRPEGSRHKRVYGQRWAVGSAFSRHKRRLGSALGGKSDSSRESECHLRVLTHNLMLLAATG